MLKQQRIRHINRKNKNLSAKTVRKYIDSHYSKTPVYAEWLSPLYFITDSELTSIIHIMKKTAKVRLTKKYIWDYFKAHLPAQNKKLKKVIIEYNEEQYQKLIMKKILQGSEDETLYDKLNVKSIKILKKQMH